MAVKSGPIFEDDAPPMPTPIAALKKALDKVERRIEESKGTITYHEGQIVETRDRVVSWGQEAHALKVAIALLEKA